MIYLKLLIGCLLWFAITWLTVRYPVRSAAEAEREARVSAEIRDCEADGGTVTGLVPNGKRDRVVCLWFQEAK